jgi:hypothetical protein
MNLFLVIISVCILLVSDSVAAEKQTKEPFTPISTCGCKIIRNSIDGNAGNYQKSNNVGYVSAITALLAVIMSPFVTFRIAKKQMMIPLVKTSNEMLLDNTSKFISDVNSYISKKEKYLLQEIETVDAIANIMLTYYKINIILSGKNDKIPNMISSYDFIIDKIKTNEIDEANNGKEISAKMSMIISLTREYINTEYKNSVL